MTDPDVKVATFNGPLEAGMRVVSLLGAANPQAFDLQRLVAFDYLLVHTEEVAGPPSLHPPAPMHTSGFFVRRQLVENGIRLMMTRNLVEEEFVEEGICYRAGENSILFLSSLSSTYFKDLNQRAEWLIEKFGHLTDDEFRGFMGKFLSRWVEEFQNQEQSKGAE